MKNQIKAVIFDMDGVLIEAKDWHYNALNKALGIFGFEISRYDHLVTYDGLPTSTKLKMLSKEYGLPNKLHGFINDLKQQHTMELIAINCKPIFYHEYALSKLKSEGYQIACASNSIKNTINVMLNRSNLISYMDEILSADDVSKPKPDPEMYVNTIKKLNRSPDECLIVEDNEKGITAAKASGAHVLEVDQIDEVNFQNIKKMINEIEELNK
jgi:beta-phosphoglucomutase-like phosphatase (HAD superfamily)